MRPGTVSGGSVKVTRPTPWVRTDRPSIASPEPSGLQITTQCLSAEGLSQSATPPEVPVGKGTAKFFSLQRRASSLYKLWALKA